MKGIEEMWGTPIIPDFIELENKRLAWSLETFPTATPFSSLKKAKVEIKEIEDSILLSPLAKPDTSEYVDFIMCILDSAGRSGITMVDIIQTYSEKLQINLKRTWKDNGDGTYSHIKEKETTNFKLFSAKVIEMMFCEKGSEFTTDELNDWYVHYKNSVYDSIEEFTNFFFEDHTPETHFEWLRSAFPGETQLYENEGNSVGDNYE